MKIGILTLPLHTNYGGILQAYALQTVLERLGHEVEVIGLPLKRAKVPYPTLIWSIIKRLIKKYLLGRSETIILQEKYVEKSQPLVEQYTRCFIDKNINIHYFDNISQIPVDYYNCIVVGSDQVWRRSPHNSIVEFFLAFAENWNIKRIAYAASFGGDEITYTENELNKCKQLAGLFDFVSVREKSGVLICKKHFDINALFVLDPTMLLISNDYIKLVNKHQNNRKKSLMVYILDETIEKKQIRDMISKDYCLTSFTVNSKVEKLSAPLTDRIQPPVEEWIKGFMEADFVFTDSFHACVFSILFNKQFLVYGNVSRGKARFDSLLSLFGLENRYISSINDYRINDEIDYSEVNRILSEKREYSMRLLSEALK